MNTIIYMTENTLDEHIATVCRRMLVKAAGDNPIISVSQKPIDLGRNICVGEIGRNWLSIYKQQLAGAKAAETEHVAIAEHDCLYTEEHFNWTPPQDDTFYFNDNCWLVEWNTNRPDLQGVYSRWKRNRMALSQLICNRKLLIESTEEKLYLLEQGLKGFAIHTGPGVFPADFVKAARIAVSGSCAYLSPYLEHHLTKFKSESFLTELPNLDIRHKTNFTGPRRGKNRTYNLPHWGEFKYIMV